MSPRGAGFLFGSDVVQTFNEANGIDLICRAHQLVMEGYKWHFNESVRNFFNLLFEIGKNDLKIQCCVCWRLTE